MESIDQIEFYDFVVHMSLEADELVLELRPAYVHHWAQVAGKWQGTGRTQAARIRLKNGRARPGLPSAAVEIANGWIRIDEDLTATGSAAGKAALLAGLGGPPESMQSRSDEALEEVRTTFSGQTAVLTFRRRVTFSHRLSGVSFKTNLAEMESSRQRSGLKRRLHNLTPNTLPGTSCRTRPWRVRDDVRCLTALS